MHHGCFRRLIKRRRTYSSQHNSVMEKSQAWQVLVIQKAGQGSSGSGPSENMCPSSFLSSLCSIRTAWRTVAPLCSPRRCS